MENNFDDILRSWKGLCLNKNQNSCMDGKENTECIEIGEFRGKSSLMRKQRMEMNCKLFIASCLILWLQETWIKFHTCTKDTWPWISINAWAMKWPISIVTKSIDVTIVNSKLTLIYIYEKTWSKYISYVYTVSLSQIFWIHGRNNKISANWNNLTNSRIK